MLTLGESSREGSGEKNGNDDVIWRSGTHRVRAEKRCNKSVTISAGNYCEDYCSGGIQDNYNCGGGTITLNRCGTNNADKVWNIDENKACKSCAANLENNGYIYSNWECKSGPGLNEQKIWYKPKKKTYKTEVRVV